MSAIVFDRDQPDWGSTTEYADGTKLPWKLDKLVLHYGGSTDPGDGEAHEAKVLRNWQSWHINGRGWTDIAYNFAVGNTGLPYRLRGFNRSGATSGDLDDDGIKENYEALALVWIGGAPHEPTDAAYATMGRMVLEVFDEYGEVPVTVHSDHKATSCPGDFWRAWRDRQGWLDDVEPPQEEDSMAGFYIVEDQVDDRANRLFWVERIQAKLAILEGGDVALGNRALIEGAGMLLGVNDAATQGLLTKWVNTTGVGPTEDRRLNQALTGLGLDHQHEIEGKTV